MTATRSRSLRRVDPRLLARRRSVARHEGLRRLWLIAGLTVVASLAIGGIAITRSSLLDVEAVEVVGANRADQRQIATAAAIELGDPLVGIDRAEVLGHVQSVPWVAEADLARSWDGVVTITVVERVGIVAFQSGSRFAVVDRTGQQLEVVASRPEGFWPVAGLEATGVPGQPVDDDGTGVIALVEQLTAPIAQVTSSITAENGDLHLELASGGRANLGDDRRLADKLVALETMLQRVDLSCLDTIDVRVPSAPTVRRTPAEGSNEEPLGSTGGC